MGRRRTIPVTTVGQFWNGLKADYGVAGSYAEAIEGIETDIESGTHGLAALDTELGLLVTNYLGHATHGLVQLETLVDELETRLTAIRAGYLNNLNNADLLNIPDLTNLTPARQAYLDNIDASLKELFYEHFAYTVDDLTDATETAASTATNPERLINNNIGDNTSFTLNQFVEVNLGSVCYVKRMRFHSDGGSNSNDRYRLQAYVNGVWEDCLTEIVDPDDGTWGSWLTLTTPRTSILWRFECTTFDTTCVVREIELDGVGVG